MKPLPLGVQQIQLKLLAELPGKKRPRKLLVEKHLHLSDNVRDGMKPPLMLEEEVVVLLLLLLLLAFQTLHQHQANLER